MSQKIAAHNTCIIPIVGFVSSALVVGSDGVRFETELKRASNLDMKIRKIMRKERALSASASKARIHIDLRTWDTA